MKIIRLIAGIIILGYLSLSGRGAAASIIDQMSFEEVTQQADAVILGKVVFSPDLGTLDEATGQVSKRHRVRVEEYFKGAGPTEIEVVTLGGRFEAPKTLNGSKIQEMIYGGLPQLPAPGTEVLLFLQTRQGANSFRIYSASHGVRIVQPSEKGSGRWVALIFRDASMMPSNAGKTLEDAKPGDTLLSDEVQVTQLKALFERMGNPPKSIPAERVPKGAQR